MKITSHETHYLHCNDIGARELFHYQINKFTLKDVTQFSELTRYERITRFLAHLTDFLNHMRTNQIKE